MASETISFRCRGELKDWLDSYAEERMMTVSMVAQQIIAEKYLEEKSDSEPSEEVPNSRDSEEREESREEREESREERSEPSETENQESEESEEEREPDPADEIFELHEDRWYVPSSNRVDYAVRKANGEIQYYKTKKGAAARLAEEYGADGIDVDMTAIQGGNYGQ